MERIINNQAAESVEWEMTLEARADKIAEEKLTAHRQQQQAIESDRAARFSSRYCHPPSELDGVPDPLERHLEKLKPFPRTVKKCSMNCSTKDRREKQQLLKVR